MNQSTVKLVTGCALSFAALAGLGLAEENRILKTKIKRVVDVNDYYVDILRRHEVPLDTFDKIAINNLVGHKVY